MAGVSKWILRINTILTFISSFLITFWVIFLLINTLTGSKEISGTPALLIIIADFGCSLGVAIFSARTQKKLMVNSRLLYHIILMAVIIIGILIFLPTPFTYTIY